MKLPSTLVLEGQQCTLVSLTSAHLPKLAQLASDPDIWQHLPLRGNLPDVFWDWAEDTLHLKKIGSSHPFVVIDNYRNEIIGTTRFQDIQAEHFKMDIGWTWYARSVWGSHINTEAKSLMLHYAFEECGAARVGFKVDENNKRSQRALEKIGATREGVFHKHMMRPDGTHRTSFFYSIIDDNWLDVKRRLYHILDTKVRQPVGERAEYSIV